MTQPTHDYIAMQRCGCVVAVYYDDDTPAMYRRLGEWREAGLLVARVTVTEAVQRFSTPCPHELVQASLVEVDSWKKSR